MGLKINGEPIELVQGQIQRNDTTWELELDGASTVALQFTEKDQTSPAGRYRLYLDGDELALQRGRVADLSRWDTFFKVTSAGPFVLVGGVEVNLSELALQLTILKQTLEILVGEVPIAGPNALVE